jgi:hypothetical protein
VPAQTVKTKAKTRESNPRIIPSLTSRDSQMIQRAGDFDTTR